MVKQIKKTTFIKKKDLYINNIKNIDPINIVEYIKINRKKVNIKSIYSTHIWLRSDIQSTKNRFKIIRFTNNQKEKQEN